MKFSHRQTTDVGLALAIASVCVLSSPILADDDRALDAYGGFSRIKGKQTGGDSPRNENGFLDPLENYRPEWTRVIQAMNARAVELHTLAE